MVAEPVRQIGRLVRAMDAARKGTCLPGAVEEASKHPGRMTEGGLATPFVP